MKPGSDLAETMALLAEEHLSIGAPAAVERAVFAEFEAARRRRIWKMAAAGAIAAILVLGVFSVHQPKNLRRPVEARVIAPVPLPIAGPVHDVQPKLHRHLSKRAVAPPTAPEADPFIAIPYTVPLAPEERTAVVRMTLSPAAMAAVGFPFQSGVPQQADVLISEDGRARAIRLVANSDYR